MKTVIINQARMTSTRLPGKVLMEVQGRPLLDIQIERLRRVPGADDLIVATTTNASDDPIVSLCRRLGVTTYRGPEEDVLARFHGAAQAGGAHWVVRVTSDCPLIDPQIVGQVIAKAQEAPGSCDYASNTLTRTFPRGLDAECFTAHALRTAAQEAAAPEEREHVTPFLYRHPERFRLREITCPADLSHHRWTVDTPEDFELIRRMLDALLPNSPVFGLRECLALLERHLDWVELNRGIVQKPTAP